LINIGNTNSLACRPTLRSHRQLDAQELVATQVSEDLGAISLGIQPISDIITHIEQTLAKVYLKL